MEEGVSFRKWLGVNSILASGSYEWDIEIWIDWDLYSGSGFDLYWTGWSEPGGSKSVSLIPNDETEIDYGSCTLGGSSATFCAVEVDYAEEYLFEITGFGIGSDSDTSSSNCITFYNLDTNVEGTAKARVRIEVCGWSEWSDWVDFPM